MRHRYTVIFNEVDSEILNRSIQVLAETPHEAAVRAKVMSTGAGIDAQDFVVIAGWNKILLYEGEISDEG